MYTGHIGVGLAASRRATRVPIAFLLLASQGPDWIELVLARFVADERTLDMLEAGGRVVARYVDANPNGSMRDIAGIANETGNVVGLMPHPEHAIDSLTGPGDDGLPFFTSVLKALVAV